MEAELADAINYNPAQPQHRRGRAGGAEAVARAVERTPSLARYPVGMASPKVRTSMRTGDLASWDLDRQCAVAASLGHRVEVVLVPPGMRAVVAFEPA